MRHRLIYIFLLIASGSSTGQTLLRSNQYIDRYQYQSEDTTIYLESEKEISAIAIKSFRPGVFEIVSDNDELVIPRDEDTSTPTYFLSLENPKSSIILKAPSGLTFDVFLISSGPSPAIDLSRYREASINECGNPPPSVPQSTWRGGLPEPNYSRSFHEVFHNVVHHAAGSNTNTNYTQVVRDIYLYHTEVNGWSDIGYNYLIAQDGTLFAGRDPGSGSQDNVRGAHFCGSNTGTLGVCLLGNYETANPTSASINTLTTFLTYQLLSQGRNPFDTYNHPLGNLETVIGHRDGCSTLCPGENVYSLLNEIRLEVEQSIENCETNESLAINADTTLVRVNQLLSLRAVGNYDQFQWLVPGAAPFSLSGNEISIDYSVPGFYDVTLIGQNDSGNDTLFMENFIQVSIMADEPVVFPNPAQAFEDITIDFKEEIVRSQLLDINGKLVGEWGSENVVLNNIQPGIYFLTIQSVNNVFNERLIIL
ncbi:N-acetylmuramoyl-L-alanine amidase [Ekhidna sp.]|uniref:N-acetylmuramoyl-L-alanine amidase n=1 Tax=Ekhidna sp. TaxID=2608089 RepID=UPI003BAC4947